MCGIGGVLGSSVAQSREWARLLMAGIAHRGPDDQGLWSDGESGLTMGHRRLSIVDLSEHGHQPMRSASGRYVVTYNGEIYNFAQLRTELDDAGLAPAWRGHSDTEVLIACFDVWGIAQTLKKANGMFAMAIWDSQTREITFARDRLGEKPLYLGWVGHSFVFASELKVLRVLPGWSPRMSFSAIAGFLHGGYIHGCQSAIQGVLRLPAGTLLTVGLEALRRRNEDELIRRMEPFWSLADAATSGLDRQFSGDDGELDEALFSLLEDSVRRRMLSDVPLGAFLSGGVDSSLVVALMQRHSTTPVNTFSLGFHEGGFDEAPHAAAVSRHLGTQHHELYVHGAQARDLVPRLSEVVDEPFADASLIPTMLLSQLTRRHVTVALSGDGGDEIFAGYGRYAAILRLIGMARWLPARARGVPSGLLSLAATSIGFAGVGDGMRFRLERLSERMASLSVDDLRLAFISGGGASRLRSALIPPEARRHVSVPTRLSHPLLRLLYADQADYLPENILPKVDRASMRYGLEVRPPILDHRLVEFAWTLPPDALLRKGEGKTPLKRLLARFVPVELSQRSKQGFTPPIGEWLRGDLREWSEAHLDEASLRDLPMIDAGGVRRLWASHLEGRVDAGFALWCVLMLSTWKRASGATA